jgi:uncharacterized protein DUF4189
MRRLYILLAAALIAATLVALAVAPAGAAGKQTEKYAAIAVNEFTGQVFVKYGVSKWRATHEAYWLCQRQSGNSEDHYCEGTGWVRDGWIALYYEENQTQFYRNKSWGFGWADNGYDAQVYAEKYCEQRATKPCEFRELVQTSRWPGKSTGGSW